MFDNKYTIFIIIGTIACSNIVYKSITLREEIVYFKKKFKILDRNPYNLYECILLPKYGIQTFDSQNYTLANSILVKQDSEALFKNIETNKHYKVKYWGIHAPKYGLYKKIYKIDDIKGHYIKTNGSLSNMLGSTSYTLTPMNSLDIFN
jgi:hypothetical protein